MRSPAASSRLTPEAGRPAPDLRAWVRHPCSLNIAWQGTGPPPAPRLYAATVVTLSAKGAGLVSDAAARPGEVLVLHLRNPAADFSGGCRARVVHATRRSDGRWLVGCVLERDLGPAELSALLG
jgi:hypothetical protein